MAITGSITAVYSRGSILLAIATAAEQVTQRQHDSAVHREVLRQKIRL